MRRDKDWRPYLPTYLPLIPRLQVDRLTDRPMEVEDGRAKKPTDDRFPPETTHQVVSLASLASISISITSLRFVGLIHMEGGGRGAANRFGAG